MNSKTVRVYVILTALYSASAQVVSGIYTNYMRQAGLSEFELNMVNMVFFITITVAEIPTGLFADVFGRKRSFVISAFLMSLSMTLFAFARTMPGFMVAECIGGIAATFMSGAFEAWVVDSLKYEKDGTDIQHVFASGQKACLGAAMAAMLVGGYVADLSMSATWLIGAVLFLVCGTASQILMHEHYFEKQVFSFRSGIGRMSEVMRKSVREVRSNEPFRFVVVTGFIQLFALMSPNMEWPKVFAENIHSNGHFGALLFLSYGAVLVGTHCSQHLHVRLGCERKTILASQGFIGLSLVAAAMVHGLPLMTLYFLLHQIGRGLYRPQSEAFLQRNIPSEERATLSSFESVTGHLGGMIGLFMTGVVASTLGARTAWVVSGSVLVTASLILLRKGRKNP